MDDECGMLIMKKNSKYVKENFRYKNETIHPYSNTL